MRRSTRNGHATNHHDLSPTSSPQCGKFVDPRPFPPFRPSISALPLKGLARRGLLDMQVGALPRTDPVLWMNSAGVGMFLSFFIHHILMMSCFPLEFLLLLMENKTTFPSGFPKSSALLPAVHFLDANPQPSTLKGISKGCKASQMLPSSLVTSSSLQGSPTTGSWAFSAIKVLGVYAASQGLNQQK